MCGGVHQFHHAADNEGSLALGCGQIVTCQIQADALTVGDGDGAGHGSVCCQTVVTGSGECGLAVPLLPHCVVFTAFAPGSILLVATNRADELGLLLVEHIVVAGFGKFIISRVLITYGAVLISIPANLGAGGRLCVDLHDGVGCGQFHISGVVATGAVLVCVPALFGAGRCLGADLNLVVAFVAADVIVTAVAADAGLGIVHVVQLCDKAVAYQPGIDILDGGQTVLISKVCAASAVPVSLVTGSKAGSLHLFHCGQGMAGGIGVVVDLGLATQFTGVGGVATLGAGIGCYNAFVPFVDAGGFVVTDITDPVAAVFVILQFFIAAAATDTDMLCCVVLLPCAIVMAQSLAAFEHISIIFADQAAADTALVVNGCVFAVCIGLLCFVLYSLCCEAVTQRIAAYKGIFALFATDRAALPVNCRIFTVGRCFLILILYLLDHVVAGSGDHIGIGVAADITNISTLTVFGATGCSDGLGQSAGVLALADLVYCQGGGSVATVVCSTSSAVVLQAGVPYGPGAVAVVHCTGAGGQIISRIESKCTVIQEQTVTVLLLHICVQGQVVLGIGAQHSAAVEVKSCITSDGYAVTVELAGTAGNGTAGDSGGSTVKDLHVAAAPVGAGGRPVGGAVLHSTAGHIEVGATVGEQVAAASSRDTTADLSVFGQIDLGAAAGHIDITAVIVASTAGDLGIVLKSGVAAVSQVEVTAVGVCVAALDPGIAGNGHGLACIDHTAIHRRTAGELGVAADDGSGCGVAADPHQAALVGAFRSRLRSAAFTRNCIGDSLAAGNLGIAGDGNSAVF